MYHDGIPLTRDYREAIESNVFKEMEKWSDGFLLANKTILKSYKKKWVSDPLHQWSRQWEYPYVYNKVQQVIHSESRAKILDAGSGVTFFPYYLNTHFENAHVYCCDYDNSLESIYKQINAGKEMPVQFSSADLRDLPYENESFDLVYCISVLEHTHDYKKIIEQFYNILRPGGALIVTFDISLDGTRDIDIDKATALLTSLVEQFEQNSDCFFDLRSDVLAPEVFTTLTAKHINPALLPWSAPSFLYQAKSFFTTGRFSSWPPCLTVSCLGLTKQINSDK